MSNFRVRATFGDVSKNFEFHRAKEADLTLGQLKQLLEKSFGEGSITLRASGTLLQHDSQLHEALHASQTAPYLHVAVSAGSSGSTQQTPSKTAQSGASSLSQQVIPKSAQHGAPAASTSDSIQCPGCTNLLPATAKFCSGCGFRIDSGTSEGNQDHFHKTGVNNASSYAEDKCQQCGQEVESGVSALDKKFHRDCFVCNLCKVSLVGKGFQQNPNNGMPVCGQCYAEEFGQRCSSCNKAITSAYIVVGGKTHHKECFVCSNCQSPFTNGYFQKNGKNLCNSCKDL